MNPLAVQVKVALTEAGVSVTDLAKALGLQRPGFSSRLNAGRLSDAELHRIAELTGYPIEAFRRDVRVQMGHRTAAVDALIQRTDGTVVAVETKSGRGRGVRERISAEYVASVEYYRGMQEAAVRMMRTVVELQTEIGAHLNSHRTPPSSSPTAEEIEAGIGALSQSDARSAAPARPGRRRRTG